MESRDEFFRSHLEKLIECTNVDSEFLLGLSSKELITNDDYKQLVS